MRCRIIANHLFIKDEFTDLKSLVLWTCRFDPGSGHHLKSRAYALYVRRPFLFKLPQFYILAAILFRIHARIPPKNATPQI
ncbi:hypothetical protein DND47_04605 [Pseudomonas syringae pv. syringae]|nr:hypothetical protein DND47_04605 [Pseudomonas syringae pv. syringae]